MFHGVNSNVPRLLSIDKVIATPMSSDQQTYSPATHIRIWVSLVYIYMLPTCFFQICSPSFLLQWTVCIGHHGWIVYHLWSNEQKVNLFPQLYLIFIRSNHYIVVSSSVILHSHYDIVVVLFIRLPIWIDCSNHRCALVTLPDAQCFNHPQIASGPRRTQLDTIQRVDNDATSCCHT